MQGNSFQVQPAVQIYGSYNISINKIDCRVGTIPLLVILGDCSVCFPVKIGGFCTDDMPEKTERNFATFWVSSIPSQRLSTGFDFYVSRH